MQKSDSGYFVCKQLKASEMYRAVQKSYNNKYYNIPRQLQGFSTPELL
jgi:hypothetical protein